MADVGGRQPRVAMFARDIVRGGHPWLTADLAQSLIDAGCHVDLFVYAPTRPSAGVDGASMRFAPFALGVKGRWLIRLPAVVLGHFWMLARFLPPLICGRYELVVSFTPFGLYTPLAPLLRRLGRARNAGFVWDFYPIQRIQMGLSQAGWMSRLLYRIEHFETVRLDHVLLMTPMNETYLDSYHPGVRGRRDVVYLWRSTSGFPEEGVRTKESFGLHESTQYAVFGGSLVAGRDLSLLLDAATVLQQQLPTVVVLIVGGGPLSDSLREEVRRRQLSNVQLLEPLPLTDYLSLLQLCSVGVVVTSADVDSPSFPSKALDYMWAGLPVVACVRAETDFGQIIESQFHCGVSCSVGDACALAAAIGTCIDDHANSNRLGRSGQSAFRSDLSPDRVARILIEGMKHEPG